MCCVNFEVYWKMKFINLIRVYEGWWITWLLIRESTRGINYIGFEILIVVMLSRATMPPAVRNFFRRTCTHHCICNLTSKRHTFAIQFPRPLSPVPIELLQRTINGETYVRYRDNFAKRRATPQTYADNLARKQEKKRRKERPSVVSFSARRHGRSSYVNWNVRGKGITSKATHVAATVLK